MTDTVHRSATVPPEAAGNRLDLALARIFPEFSRSRLQQWIKAGEVRVDGCVLKPRDKLVGGERIELAGVMETLGEVEPEAIELDIVFEDDSLLVLNKPAGRVVHPGAGNQAGTIQNALLHHAPALAAIPRAGLVHRLDKDTSGLMVIAKTLTAHKLLVEQLQARTVGREYLALVSGSFTAGGRVEAPIGRHPRDRTRMGVSESGRPAVTHYRIAERFQAHTLLRVSLETGRTHQIRVHMAHIGRPLVGDPVYGGRLLLPKGSGDAAREALRGFRRQALHATRLTLTHPASGEEVSWEAPPPPDLAELLEVLRRECPFRLEEGGRRGRR